MTHINFFFHQDTPLRFPKKVYWKEPLDLYLSFCPVQKITVFPDFFSDLYRSRSIASLTNKGWRTEELCKSYWKRGNQKCYILGCTKPFFLSKFQRFSAEVGKDKKSVSNGHLNELVSLTSSLVSPHGKHCCLKKSCVLSWTLSMKALSTTLSSKFCLVIINRPDFCSQISLHYNELLELRYSDILQYTWMKNFWRKLNYEFFDVQ